MHGDVRLLRRDRRGRVRADHPARARARRQLHRYGPALRAADERGAGGRAVAGHRDEYVIATKFARRTDKAKPGDIRRSAARRLPRAGSQSIDGSLSRLGTDYVDLYYQHRVDPSVPIEETVGAMAELVQRARSGTSASARPAPDTIRRAHAVHPIAAVQTEYSLWTRDPEDEVLPTCRELGIGFVPYSPLGRGFLAGRFTSPEELDEGDFRRSGPRFTGDNLEANMRLVARSRSSPPRRTSRRRSSRSRGSSPRATTSFRSPARSAAPTSSRTPGRPTSSSARRTLSASTPSCPRPPANATTRPGWPASTANEAGMASINQ